MNAIDKFRLQILWHDFDITQKNHILGSSEFEDYDKFLCRTLPIEKLNELFKHYNDVSFRNLFRESLDRMTSLITRYVLESLDHEFEYDLTFFKRCFPISMDLFRVMFINSHDCFQIALHKKWCIVDEKGDYSDFFQTAMSAPNFNFQSAKLLMSRTNTTEGFKKYSLEQLLVEAAKRNKIEFVQLFLGAGADPSFNKQQALRYAEKSDNKKIIKLLKGYF